MRDVAYEKAKAAATKAQEMLDDLHGAEDRGRLLVVQTYAQLAQAWSAISIITYDSDVDEV